MLCEKLVNIYSFIRWMVFAINPKSHLTGEFRVDIAQSQLP